MAKRNLHHPPSRPTSATVMNTRALTMPTMTTKMTDNIPEEAALKCLLDADLLRRAYDITGPKFKVIKEYEFLRGLLGKVS